VNVGFDAVRRRLRGEVVGFPATTATIPLLTKKSLEEIATFL
jgi:hypothetical protein